MSKKSSSTKRTVKTVPTKPKLDKLQRLSLFFFNRPRKTAIIWLVLIAFGILCYTALLKREGFPNIETPFAMSQGTYLANDPAKVDKDVAKPLSEFLLKQDGVKNVQTQSFDNFYTAVVSYEESVNAETRSTELQKAATDQKILPENATGKLEAFKFGFTQRGDDMVISFYAKDNNLPTDQLATKAKRASDVLKSQNLGLIEDISIIDPFETAKDPVTGAFQANQKSFDRFGQRANGQNTFYKSIVIGVNAKDKVDNLVLDRQIREAVSALNSDPEFSMFHAEVSASNAPSINQQVNELQSTLLEGLAVVLVVASIVIAIRASFITVLSMVTVIATVIGLLYAIGYTLNTITLFGLVLSLSLIVDDTIIMVEALDSQRRRRKNANEVVEVATRKVGRAMTAATSTAALSFAPLLFVGGILGSFIRAIPITIISALVISLFVALVFIPLFARYLLLGKGQMGEGNVREFSAGIEARIARFISAPMLWAKHSKKKLFLVGFSAVFIGFGFIGAGGFLFTKVTFNIFPPTKDSNQLSVITTFPAGTNIEEAQKIIDNVDDRAAKVIGGEFVQAAYYGQGSIQNALLTIEITDYKKREITAPQLTEKLKNEFAGFTEAKIAVGQVDNGPPAAAFTARVDSSKDRAAADRLASDIGKYLQSTELKRVDGSIAKIDAITPPNASIYARDDNKQYLEVGAKFVDTDTSTLVTLAQKAVEKEFTSEKIKSYGLEENSLSFNFGQEDENQDSFKTLALAFPALLFVIFLVLAFQFKSLLQPLLIFTALPFSLFGITLGLYLTDNAFSFFAMLGFFALIGLSIKNTILLTDYANQQRQEGLHPVDAAHEALAERFRPLIATSLTAVCSLIPLAISSPFWEGLAVVLIFGLLSSTFLVITVFPYYYLGAEYLRSRVSRKMGITWLTISTLAIVFLIKAGAGPIAPLSPVIAAIALTLAHRRTIKQA